MTTLILGRSLLRLHRAENIQLVLNDMIESELPDKFRSSEHTWSDVSFYDNHEASPMHPKSVFNEEEIQLYRLGY